MQNEFKYFSQFILAIILLVLSTGCTNQPSGPNKDTAQKALEAELDKWMTGQESKAKTFTWRLKGYEPPLSYNIRSVMPCKPKIALHDETLHEVFAKHSDDRPAFKVVVDLDFRSQGNTAISEVGEYTVTWVKEWNEWSIDEIMR